MRRCTIPAPFAEVWAVPEGGCDDQRPPSLFLPSDAIAPPPLGALPTARAGGHASRPRFTPEGGAQIASEGGPALSAPRT